MDWFRPALSSILLLAATLGFFFWAPLWSPLEGLLVAGGRGVLLAFTLARIALLLALGYGLSRVSARGGAAVAPVALVVAAPAVVVGGLMGIYAAITHVHVVIVGVLALALSAACFLGAARGTRP